MSSMVDVRIERTPETHMGDLSEIDSDFEAWSLMAMSPSPLPRQHSRLIADSQIDIQDIFQGLGNSMLSFESPPSNRQYARHSRRKHVSKLSIVSRVLWMMVLLASCIWFWLLFQKRFERVEANRTASFENDETQQLQFFSASNKYIRYIGRWTAVEGNDRIDGSFPGVYFEFAVVGTRTIQLSLCNRNSTSGFAAGDPKERRPGAAGSFLSANNTSHAAPISLLALVDDNEYIVLPGANGIVRVLDHDLEPNASHRIRIVAPTMDTPDPGILQLRGIWIDRGGALVSTDSYEKDVNVTRKTLEVVTDTFTTETSQNKNPLSPSKAIFEGVMSWYYLLGEMFDVDHVRVGMNGMCLIQNCVGANASPAGIGDVFFQSGPHRTEHFSEPWRFDAYVPDVMVMNLGNTDWQSFQMHGDEYNKTIWNMTVEFEDTYVTLIKAIRALAYPEMPTMVDRGVSGQIQQQHRGPLPIFVMRPFRGQLEQATLSVVNRLRLEGDKFVFWLDTSGWLNTEIDFQGHVEDQDFFLDEKSPSRDWHLTEKGHRRVAMFVHMHVCGYLAVEPDRCVFLPPTSYDTPIQSNTDLGRITTS